ncbi:hypothetical protein U1Q18_039125 [Sarracenia purpurea var. burkii]
MKNRSGFLIEPVRHRHRRFCFCGASTMVWLKALLGWWSKVGAGANSNLWFIAVDASDDAIDGDGWSIEGRHTQGLRA